jgi:hypothetical protein
MKRTALVAALVLGLAILSAGTAMAAGNSFTVTISDCGANYWGYYTFTATDTNTSGFGTVRFFIVQDTGGAMQKASYAAALTALSTGGKAIILADPASGACMEVRASN